MALVVKNMSAKAGDIRDLDLNLGLGRSPGERHGNPLQYSCLENPHRERSLAAYSAQRVGNDQSDLACTETSTSASLTTQKPLTLWITTNCRKFLKRWEYQTTYLPPEKSVCRSRSNRTGHGTTDWFQIGKGVHQGCILSPAYLTYMQSTS